MDTFLTFEIIWVMVRDLLSLGFGIRQSELSSGDFIGRTWKWTVSADYRDKYDLLSELKVLLMEHDVEDFLFTKRGSNDDLDWQVFFQYKFYKVVTASEPPY